MPHWPPEAAAASQAPDDDQDAEVEGGAIRIGNDDGAEAGDCLRGECLRGDEWDGEAGDSSDDEAAGDDDDDELAAAAAASLQLPMRCIPSDLREESVGLEPRGRTFLSWTPNWY
jgi:hypothetical protein